MAANGGASRNARTSEIDIRRSCTCGSMSTVRVILAQHRHLPREAARNAEREQIAGQAGRRRANRRTSRRCRRTRPPSRSTCAPEPFSCRKRRPAMRGEEWRNAHQHERVGDRGARERADEKEERAGEEQPGDETGTSDCANRLRHAPTVQREEHAGHEHGHEQRAPEDDLPGVRDRQRAHQQAARRPADRGDDHEEDCAAMAGGGSHVIRGVAADKTKRRRGRRWSDANSSKRVPAVNIQDVVLAMQPSFRESGNPATWVIGGERPTSLGERLRGDDGGCMRPTHSSRTQRVVD